MAALAPSIDGEGRDLVLSWPKRALVWQWHESTYKNTNIWISYQFCQIQSHKGFHSLFIWKLHHRLSKYPIYFFLYQAWTQSIGYRGMRLGLWLHCFQTNHCYWYLWHFMQNPPFLNTIRPRCWYWMYFRAANFGVMQGKKNLSIPMVTKISGAIWQNGLTNWYADHAFLLNYEHHNSKVEWRFADKLP